VRKKGSVSFTTPKIYGDYEFRYFSSGSYQHVCRSNVLHVGPVFEVKGELDAHTKTIRVFAHQISGNSYSPWVGLYEKKQSDNTQYLTWARPKNNEVIFTAPIKPGEYEVRVFPYSYFHVAKSETITIEGQDILKATISAEGDISVATDIVTVDPYRESAWLGIYLTAENDNRQWRKYKNITERKGVITFKAPKIHGVYEVRLFANKTYDTVAKSNPLTLEK